MSQPEENRDRSERATTAWGDGGSEETQIVRPQAGGYGQGPSTGPNAQPAPAPAPAPAPDQQYGGTSEPTQRVGSYPVVADAPTAAPATGPTPTSGAPAPAAWAPHNDQPTFAEQPAYAAQPAMTSIYPQSQPGYAPAGYPPAYAPAVVVAAPPAPAAPEQTSNRVGPGFICALAGIVLTAGGMLLAGKFGVAAATELTQRSVVIKDSGLATLGALLILGAFVLNGWSPWATVIPGIVLTGIGGWALFDSQATVTVSRWTNSVLTTNQLTVWHTSGVTLILGLAMLAASTAATIARAGGKRDGQILGRRQV